MQYVNEGDIKELNYSSNNNTNPIQKVKENPKLMGLLFKESKWIKDDIIEEVKLKEDLLDGKLIFKRTQILIKDLINKKEEN